MPRAIHGGGSLAIAIGISAWLRLGAICLVRLPGLAAGYRLGERSGGGAAGSGTGRSMSSRYSSPQGSSIMSTMSLAIFFIAFWKPS